MGGSGSVGARIHPTAIVDARAEIAHGVTIGPYAIVEAGVRIGPDTELMAHVVVRGPTGIGASCVFHPFAVVGGAPQAKRHHGGPSPLEMGDHNVVRESVTIHRGSQQGDITIIGNDNFLMHNAHVAHDCRIGNSTIIAGGALLAGWVEVGDQALVSGNCVVHQFVRIGRLALVRGGARASRDIPPFCIADGVHTVRGVNVVGLERAGLSDRSISALRRAFTVLFGGRHNLGLALSQLEAQGSQPAEVSEVIEFIRKSKRGVAFGPRQSGGEPPY